MSKILKSFKTLLEECLLAEDRLPTLKQKFANITADHDRLGKHKTADDIVDHFASKADPSKNKQHTQWILQQYAKKAIRQEDHPRIRSALKAFETHKSKLKEKDLNRYKTLGDLEDATASGVKAHFDSSAMGKLKLGKDHDLLHDDGGVTIHHLKTKEAACAHGQGTKWCTARDNHFNAFERYDKDGPLHVISHGGRKYQYHTGTNQFMDEKDEETDLSKVHPDIARSMIKSSHPEIKTANILFKNPHVTHEHISNALNNYKDWGLRQSALRHPNATHEHISKALRDSHKDVRKAAASHPKATPEHISKGLDDADEFVRSAAVKHPNATHEHISKALKDNNIYVRRDAVRHPNATHEHISKALDDARPYIRETAVRHPNATHEHISKALGDVDPHVLWAAVKHPNASHDHISKGLDDARPYIRETAVKHPNATHEHISKALDDDHPDVRHAALMHPNASHEHILTGLEDSDPDVRWAAKQINVKKWNG